MRIGNCWMRRWCCADYERKHQQAWGRICIFPVKILMVGFTVLSGIAQRTIFQRRRWCMRLLSVFNQTHLIGFNYGRPEHRIFPGFCCDTRCWVESMMQHWRIQMKCWWGWNKLIMLMSSSTNMNLFHHCYTYADEEMPHGAFMNWLKKSVRAVVRLHKLLIWETRWKS